MPSIIFCSEMFATGASLSLLASAAAMLVVISAMLRYFCGGLLEAGGARGAFCCGFFGGPDGGIGMNLRGSGTPKALSLNGKLNEHCADRRCQGFDAASCHVALNWLIIVVTNYSLLYVHKMHIEWVLCL